MSRTFSTSSDHLDIASLALSDTPCTISTWVKFTGSSSPQSLVWIGVSGTGDNCLALGTTFTTAIAFTVTERDTVTSSTNTIQGRPNLNTNHWYLATAVFSSHSSRAVYFNGTGKATNAVARTSTGYNALRISGDLQATPANPFNGSLAHVAVWNTNLSDAQVDSLKYVYPNQVAVGNLVNYWPLTSNASPEPDYGSGNLPLTVTGTTFSTDNPNIAGTLVRQLMGAIG